MRYHSSSVEELPGPSRGPGPRRSCSWAEMNGDVSVPVSSTSSGSNAGYNRKTWSGGHTTRRNGDFHSASNIPVQHLYPIVKLIKQEPIVKTEPVDAADEGQYLQADQSQRPSQGQGESSEEEFHFQRNGSRNIPGSSTYSTVAHQQQHEQRVMLPNPMYDLRKRLIAASSSGAGGSSSYSSDETLPNHINPSAPVSVPAPVSPTPSVEYIGTNQDLNQQETQETMFYINVDRNGYHNSHSQSPDVETEPPTPSTSTETILSIKQELEDIHCVKMTKQSQSQVVNNRRAQRQRTGHGQMQRYEMQSEPQSRQQDLWYRGDKDDTDSFYCKHCDESFPFFNRLLRHLRKHDEHNNTTNQSTAPTPSPSARSRSSTTHLQQYQPDFDDTPIILKEIRVVIPKVERLDELATMFYRERNQGRTPPAVPRPAPATSTLFPQPTYNITTPSSVVRNRRGTASKSLENISRMVKHDMVCLYCDKGFQCPEELNRHEMAHLKNVPSAQGTSEVPPSTTTTTDNFPCTLCRKVCTRPWTLKQHMKKHTNNNNKRKIFGFKSCAPQKLRAKASLTSRSNTATYQCDLCERSFTREYYMKSHKMYSHSKPWKIDSVTSPLSPSPPSQHSSAINESRYSSLQKQQQKFFPCHICGKIYTTKNGLIYHRSTKHDGVRNQQKQFLCNVCGNKFTTPGTLKRHLILHKPVTQKKKSVHCCDICGKGFAQRYNMIEHRRSHTGERPYQCPYCPNVFAYRSNLCTHKVKCQAKVAPTQMVVDKSPAPTPARTQSASTSTSQPPFSCSSCPKTFNTRQQLIFHSSIHGARLRIVSPSKYSFGATNGTGTTAVGQDQTGKATPTVSSTKLTCPICKRKFSSGRGFPIHIQSHNRVKIPSANLGKDWSKKPKAFRRTGCGVRRGPGGPPAAGTRRTVSVRFGRLKRKRIHKCRFCDKRYKFKYSQTRHEAAEHPNETSWEDQRSRSLGNGYGNNSSSTSTTNTMTTSTAATSMPFLSPFT